MILTSSVRTNGLSKWGDKANIVTNSLVKSFSIINGNVKTHLQYVLRRSLLQSTRVGHVAVYGKKV